MILNSLIILSKFNKHSPPKIDSEKHKEAWRKYSEGKDIKNKEQIYVLFKNAYNDKLNKIRQASIDNFKQARKPEDVPLVEKNRRGSFGSKIIDDKINNNVQAKDCDGEAKFMDKIPFSPAKQAKKAPNTKYDNFFGGVDKEPFKPRKMDNYLDFIAKRRGDRINNFVEPKVERDRFNPDLGNDKFFQDKEELIKLEIEKERKRRIEGEDMKNKEEARIKKEEDELNRRRENEKKLREEKIKINIDKKENIIKSKETYRVIQKLGQGMFGKVELVENSKKERFAMKTLLKTTGKTNTPIDFIREVVFLKKLQNHPNILNMVEVISNKTELKVILEFAKSNLLLYINSSKALPLSKHKDKIKVSILNNI